MIKARIKQIPEDFLVCEIGRDIKCKLSDSLIFGEKPNLNDLGEKPKNYGFLWCELEKYNLDMFSCIKELTKQLNMHAKSIGYAGIKDKLGITVQRISLENVDLEKLKKFSHEKIYLKNFLWKPKKIKLGYLDFNKFKITVRDIDEKCIDSFKNLSNDLKYFYNFFGPQRFGVENKNVETGKKILKGEIENIKKFNNKSGLIYIHAIQSKLFNEMLDLSIQENIDFSKLGQKKLLLFGYASKFSQGKLGEIERKVLKKNNLTFQDFDLENASKLRLKGGHRSPVVSVYDFSWEIKDDEKNIGKKKILLNFKLDRGVYATTFLSQFFEF